MTTLTSPPLSTLLDQLFADAEMTKTKLWEELAQLTSEQREAVMNQSDPLALYAQAEEIHLAIPRETGHLLYVLARNSRAQSIVEFGASFGISTLHLAAALKDNGGGRLISSEFLPSKVARARKNLELAGLDDIVEIREGDARETLALNLPEMIDLVFLDGAKSLYLEIFSFVKPHLRSGAMVVADNVEASPDYLTYIRSSNQYLSLPFSKEVELTVKLL